MNAIEHTATPPRHSQPQALPDLLGLDDIATMWKCSRRHARDVLVKLPGFPHPAPGSTSKKPVWLRSKVRAFARGGS